MLQSTVDHQGDRAGKHWSWLPRGGEIKRFARVGAQNTRTHLESKDQCWVYGMPHPARMRVAHPAGESGQR